MFDYKKIEFFKIIATGTLIIFIALMAFVTIVAYSRPSGHTGLSMGKLQQMRSQLSQSSGKKNELKNNSKQCASKYREYRSCKFFDLLPQKAKKIQRKRLHSIFSLLCNKCFSSYRTAAKSSK
jgi:hypothetical protein